MFVFTENIMKRPVYFCDINYAFIGYNQNKKDARYSILNTHIIAHLEVQSSNQ